MLLASQAEFFSQGVGTVQNKKKSQSESKQKVISSKGKVSPKSTASASKRIRDAISYCKHKEE